jgi:hypothetical protein
LLIQFFSKLYAEMGVVMVGSHSGVGGQSGERKPSSTLASELALVLDPPGVPAQQQLHPHTLISPPLTLFISLLLKLWLSKAFNFIVFIFF